MEKINVNNYEAFLLDYLEGRLPARDEAALRRFALKHPELQIDLSADLSNMPVLEPEAGTSDFHSLKKFIVGENDDLALSYLENELDPAGQAAFEAKLAEDDVLLGFVQDYGRTVLVPEPAQFEGRRGLLHGNLSAAREEQMLDYMEGRMHSAQKVQFESEIAASPLLDKELKLFQMSVLKPDLSVEFPDHEALKKEARIIAIFTLRRLGIAAAAILLLNGFWFLGRLGTDETSQRTKTAAILPGRATPVESQQSTGTAEPAGVGVIATRKSPAIKHSQESFPGKTEGYQLQAQESQSIGLVAVQQNTMANLMPEDHGAEVMVAGTEGHEEPSARYASIEELETAEDLPDFDLQTRKENFWQKAANIARRANKLGLTAVKAEEGEKNHFRLSFNSFSVEKK